MTIEALLFDMGKVLVDFDFDRGLERFGARTPLSAEEFRSIILDHEWVGRYEHGRILERRLSSLPSGRRQAGDDSRGVSRAWSSIFLPGLIIPEELLSNLKARYPLILVSNTNESHADFVARNYSVLDYFDHKIFSHEVGSMKPDRKIYDAAIAVAGKPPGALFFTDDREENVESAARLGIRTHQFHSVLKLVKALQNNGVQIGDFVPA
jgi:putative hydrolase of the HAD superfamily